MGLLEQFEREMKKASQKKPFIPSVYTRVTYILDTDEYNILFADDRKTPVGAVYLNRSFELTAKKPLKIPPFYFPNRNTHERAIRLMSSVNGKYLSYCNTAKEITISDQLYELNPDLDERVLREFDFETLARYELTKGMTEKWNYEKKKLEDLLRIHVDTRSEKRLAHLEDMMKELEKFTKSFDKKKSKIIN